MMMCCYSKKCPTKIQHCQKCIISLLLILLELLWIADIVTDLIAVSEFSNEGKECCFFLFFLVFSCAKRSFLVGISVIDWYPHISSTSVFTFNIEFTFDEACSFTGHSNLRTMDSETQRPRHVYSTWTRILCWLLRLWVLLYAFFLTNASFLFCFSVKMGDYWNFLFSNWCNFWKYQVIDR